MSDTRRVIGSAPAVRWHGGTATAVLGHQPSDEFREDCDFSGLAEMARFGVALGWKAASQPQLVHWKKGDEFERARQKSVGGGR